MSRQTERQAARAAKKLTRAGAKINARRAAKRALLGRQTEREKAGLYVGLSVASTISPSRSRIQKRKVQKGQHFGRVIRTIIEGGREWRLHATRGWRSNAQ